MQHWAAVPRGGAGKPVGVVFDLPVGLLRGRDHGQRVHGVVSDQGLDLGVRAASAYRSNKAWATVATDLTHPGGAPPG